MQLEFTQQEVQIIIMALGEVPLKISGPVFTKIQSQIEQQKVEIPQDHSDKVF